MNQLCKLIPGYMVSKLARQYGVDKQSRSFSPWSHVVALLYAQLTHAFSLNDVCDALKHHCGKLIAIRHATPPSRNGLSHANKNRNSDMAEALFWQMLDHFRNIQPDFGFSGRYKGLPRRFKRTIYAIDSTTIPLVANCIEWAKHRRRKAAAKCHLRLNLQTFLPEFAIIEEASHHDDRRARSLCSKLLVGEIVVFDKAYINFRHLFELTECGVFWVTRAKDNMSYRVCKKLQKKHNGRILKDELITLKSNCQKNHYPTRMRRVEALVEINGEDKVMVFITNNMDWAASSIYDLYRCRWGIEVFFKQIKQTLHVFDFLGHSKHAIRWQLWTALLLFLLLRFQAFLSQWPHSFKRAFAILRAVLWERFDIDSLLRFYGTANDKWRTIASPQTAYLPGFPLNNYGTATSLYDTNIRKC